MVYKLETIKNMSVIKKNQTGGTKFWLVETFKDIIRSGEANMSVMNLQDYTATLEKISSKQRRK